MTLHKDELSAIEKETVEDNIEYKVDFTCFGPYPGKEQSSIHPARIITHNSGKGISLSCSILDHDSLMCLKNYEELPKKRCPFINLINYLRETQEGKESSDGC